MNQDNRSAHIFEDKKSKSQVKRELMALQKLGKDLIEMKGKGLNDLPLSDVMRNAILHARTLTRGALKRQLQFIGGLMVREDVEAITKQLNNQLQPIKQEVDAFHQVESWRDGLIAGEVGLLDELIDQYEKLDRQYLTQLIRNAKKEREQQKTPKSARLLFDYLSSLSEGASS